MFGKPILILNEVMKFINNQNVGKQKFLKLWSK